MSQTFNAFAMAQEQLHAVAALMGLEPDVTTVLAMPKRELTVHFPVRKAVSSAIHHSSTLENLSGSHVGTHLKSPFY